MGSDFVYLWWRDPDLNRGHMDFQSIALPTELSRHRKCEGIIEKNVKLQALFEILFSYEFLLTIPYYLYST